MLLWRWPMPWIIHIAFFSPPTGDSSKLPLDVDDIKLFWITFTIALMHKHSCIAVQPRRLYNSGPLYCTILHMWNTTTYQFVMRLHVGPTHSYIRHAIFGDMTVEDVFIGLGRLMAKLMTKMMTKLIDALTSMSCSKPFLLRLVCTQASIWPNDLIVGGVTGNNWRFLPRPLAHVCISPYRRKDISWVSAPLWLGHASWRWLIVFRCRLYANDLLHLPILASETVSLNFVPTFKLLCSTWTWTLDFHRQ